MSDPLTGGGTFSFDGAEVVPFGVDTGKVITNTNAPTQRIGEYGPELTPEIAEQRSQIGEYIRAAQSKYGISASDAKYKIVEQLAARARTENNPDILLAIDPQFFPAKTMAFVDKEYETVLKQRDRVIAAAAARDEAAAEAVEVHREQYVEGKRRELALAVLSGAVDVDSAFKLVMGDQQFTTDEQSQALSYLETVQSGSEDPIKAQMAMKTFQRDLVRFSLEGNSDAITEAAMIASQSVRNPKDRAQISQLMDDSEKFIRDQLFLDVEDYGTSVRDHFKAPTSVDELDVADRIAGKEGARNRFYTHGADEDMYEKYEDFYMQMARDWYMDNPDASHMPLTTKRDIGKLARDMTFEFGSAYFIEGGVSNESGVNAVETKYGVDVNGDGKVAQSETQSETGASSDDSPMGRINARLNEANTVATEAEPTVDPENLPEDMGYGFTPQY